MESFTYISPLTRVVMADNAVDRVGEEVGRLGCKQALVICGSNVRKTKLLQRVVTALGTRCTAVFDEVAEHPDVKLVSRGTDLARRLGVDVLVPVGRGSTSDTAKANEPGKERSAAAQRGRRGRATSPLKGGKPSSRLREAGDANITPSMYWESLRKPRTMGLAGRPAP